MYNFDNLGSIFTKGTSPLKNRKNEYHHQILHNRIGLGTKFHRKKTILSLNRKN